MLDEIFETFISIGQNPLMSDSADSKQYGVDGPPQLHGYSRELSESKKSSLGWDDNEEGDWTCEVVCNCGEALRFLIEHGHDKTSPGWLKGKWGHRLTDLRCTACDLLIPFFHEGFHGYNAVVCKERDQMPAKYVETNRQFLKRLQCEKCGSEEFGVAVLVRYDDDDIREGLSDTPIDQWDDAYGWIQANAWCSSCQTIRSEFVGHETA